MKRFWLFALLLGLLLSPAFAQEVDWEAVDPSGQSIVFWHVHDGPNQEALDAIVQAFNESNEYGITVTAENQGSYGDVFQKMLPLLGTQDAPDLVLAYQNQAATYQLADALIDMRGFMESPTWGFSDEDEQAFFEGFVASDGFPSFGGAQLGFPPNRSMEMLYYNADWLAELGFDGPPETPEAFREMACAASQQPFSGATGAGASGYEISVGASTFASWVFAFGGDIFDDDANRYTYDSDAAVEAMQFLQDLVNDGCASIETERFAAQGNLGQGLTLFTTGSSVGIPYYQSAVDEGAQFDWNVGALPHTTPEPVMNLYGPSVSIVDTGSPERALAAWLFIKQWVSADAQAQWARVTNYFPVRRDVVEGLSDYFAENPKFETAFELLEYGVAEPPTPGYDFVRNAVDEAMASILTGADVAETLSALNEEANVILEDQLAEMP